MVKPRYYNTYEELIEWMKKNMKRLKYSIGFTHDREQTNPRLYPEEIEELFGNHTERYRVQYYRKTK
jgi:hypothetical protein